MMRVEPIQSCSQLHRALGEVPSPKNVNVKWSMNDGPCRCHCSMRNGPSEQSELRNDGYWTIVHGTFDIYIFWRAKPGGAHSVTVFAEADLTAERPIHRYGVGEDKGHADECNDE